MNNLGMFLGLAFIGFGVPIIAIIGTVFYRGMQNLNVKRKIAKQPYKFKATEQEITDETKN